MSLDWFQKWALYSPEKIAITEWNTKRALSYRELNRQAIQWSQYLLERGFQKGDRLGVLSEFRLEYFILLGVAQKTGIILVPLNYRLSARELQYMTQDSGCKLLLMESQFNPDPNCPVPIDNLEEFAEQASKSEVNELSCPKPEGHDPLFILYTSGTTGFPKGALYTHEMAIWNSLNTALRLEVNANDRCLQIMPPFHTGGWNVLSTPLLHFGASLILMPKFEPEECLRALAEESISLFMAVPTMVRMLSEASNFEAADLAALRYFIVGGEALAIPLIEKWAAKGVPIRQGYGLTEVGPNVTSLNAEDAIRKRGSIGFVNFYYDWKLITEAGTEANTGEKGELWLKSPCVSPGYWNNPDATASSREGDWLKTGDVLIQDEEGYLYLVDRLKNMYISGGENIYPSEIEHYLSLHPNISENVVVGVPDSKWGEVGCAFISSNADLKEADLRAYCEKGMARFKIPKHFVFLDELPKNTAGKIDRHALHSRFQED